uniref:AAA+ ATPase domain-containing protein n=1 Tax=Oryza nivara TaxID=4536 RepID=A0A0E0JCV2_ORYNI
MTTAGAAEGERFGWPALWSAAASLLFLLSMVQEHIPFQLQDHLAALAARLHALLSPYATITIDDKSSHYFSRCEAFFAVEAYLGASPCAANARRLRADLAEGTDRMALAVDDHEAVADDFRGATMWWRKTKALPSANVITWSPRNAERRSYRLTFHRRHRALVENAYLPHVLAEGSAVTEIIDDLDMFRDGKEYYASVGKAWKRGYLLFGPPGTGKSTMIAAMANFLDYDVYDLELTAVKSNTELRRLFIETTGKSIIVIEDIDCSIDLTGKRKKKKKDKKKKKMTPPWARDDDEEKKVTLSGLLNFIDGLWSACGGERIIIFTTNHKEKLDPALIRRGRMDMHIEMSYCCFESCWAKNYLGVEQHELFGEIRRLLEEADMSPADVAENLMPRSKTKDVDACLERLVKALHEAKEAALSKAAAAGKKKADEEIKNDSDKDPKDMKEK